MEEFMTPNALPTLNFSDLLTEKATNDKEITLKPEWRIEPRRDRHPAGWAIYKRGLDPITRKPPYLGYVGFNFPDKTDRGFPSYADIAGHANAGRSV